MAQLVEINQVGKKLMVFDFIALSDFKDKPLLAMLPKERTLTNMRMDWQIDRYDTPNTNGSADGTPVTSIENSAKDRVWCYSYAQKFRRTAGVGSIAQNISQVAGAKGGEMARAVEKKMEEISRDIEAAIASDNECQAETSAAAPYKTRGLGKWLLASAQSVLPVDSRYLTPSACINSTAAASLTEDAFKTVLAAVFQQYGKRQDLTLVCGMALKKAVTGFTQTSTGSTNTESSMRFFAEDLTAKKITSCVDVYEGDFNVVQLHPSLILNVDETAGTTTGVGDTSRGYVLAMDNLALSWGWQPTLTKLPNDGSGERVMIEAVLGLVYKNPLIGAKFAPTATRT